MTRAAIVALLLALPQDPASEFRKLVEAAEKMACSIPEFPDAVAKLDALAGPAIPAEWAHRHQVLRAQAIILKSLHAHLVRQKGTSIDMPLPGAKPASVRILDVTKTRVKVARAEGSQEFGFNELDPEWSVSAARPGFASETDASLMAGLFLAKAARWEAAFRELGKATSNHPLVLEARRRGLEGLLKQVEAATAAKRWKEAVERLAAAGKAVADDPSLVAAREKLVAAIVELAKEHSRKGDKKKMEDLIDFIVANFTGREDRIAEIRDESRWITVTDPKKFGLTGKDGQPILLDPSDKRVLGAYVRDVPGKFDGISLRIRFTKTSKESHGGPIWMGRDGRIHAWMIRDDPMLTIARLDEKTLKWTILGENKVEESETYEIQAVLDKGAVAISVNGREIGRYDAGETEIASPGLQASHGRLTFDRFRLRKKS